MQVTNNGGEKMKLVLYYHPGTRSQRVRWLLEELELDYELQYVDLFKGEANTDEYLALQPLGQLPAIKIDDEVMFESGAIVQWLADSYLDKGFAPELDSPLRRQFNQWMYFAVTNLEAPAWEIMLHSRILPEDIAVKDIMPFASQTLIKALAVLDKELQGKEYMLGSKFSAVDIMVAYILAWYPEHIEPFSNLKAYTAKLQQRPAYIRSTKD